METSSVHQSTSQSDCDGNSITPVASDEAADIVNAIVDAGPTVCSTFHRTHYYYKQISVHYFSICTSDTRTVVATNSTRVRGSGHKQYMCTPNL